MDIITYLISPLDMNIFDSFQNLIFQTIMERISSHLNIWFQGEKDFHKSNIFEVYLNSWNLWDESTMHS